MTVESTTPISGPYTGNGVTTRFQREFRINKAGDLVVTVDGTEVTSGFTVLDPTLATGDVEFAKAPDAGVEIYLTRRTSINQKTDYSLQGAVSPEQVERDLDKTTLINQELNRDRDRSLKVPIGSTGPTILIPPENHYLIADADGNLVDGGTQDQISNAQANAVIATEKAAEATARAQEATSDRQAVAADLVQTDLDTQATAADRVQTGQDRVATGQDRQAVAADLVQTDLDTQATAADRVQTGLDRQQTGADRVATGQNKAAAAVSAAQALAALSDFNDRYIGLASVDPSTDLDGSPLDGGELYYNTTTGRMRIYASGQWRDTYVDANGVLLISSNLADLENIVAARQNLGLGNVDNTSDLNKPVSTAVQNSLNGLQLGSLSNVSVSGAPSNHVMYGNGSSWVPVQIQPDYMLAPSAGESIAVNELWFTFTAARSGSVRLRFQHYGGNNDQGNNLKVYRDGSELVSWYTFSPTPIDRVIDVSFSAGQRIYYTETGGGGLISASIRMANRTLFRL